MKLKETNNENNGNKYPEPLSMTTAGREAAGSMRKIVRDNGGDGEDGSASEIRYDHGGEEEGEKRRWRR
jgi:hypothetical protein